MLHYVFGDLAEGKIVVDGTQNGSLLRDDICETLIGG